jgi:hypothetical protein
MGWGIADGATFEALLENRLNHELSGAPFAKYELLNYGVPGYYPPQQLVNLERALGMRPNAVMFVATGREPSRSVHYLAEVMHKGIDIPFPPLQEIIAKAGVRKGMKETEAKQRLMPYSRELLLYVYTHIAERAKRQQMKAIWIFLPQLREGSWQEETADTIKIAEAAGFTVINLNDLYKGKDPVKIRLAEWDEHPNAYGHQLIADQLFARLHAQRDQIFSIPPSKVLSGGHQPTVPEAKQ